MVAPLHCHGQKYREQKVEQNCVPIVTTVISSDLNAFLNTNLV